MRHGATALFAALDVATWQVITRGRRRQEFIAFLILNDCEAPTGLRVHIVLDNYSTHRRKVKKWLSKRKRCHAQFTPVHSSWLKFVKRWFALIGQLAIKRGSFRSAPQLVAIDQIVEHQNAEPDPFARAASAGSIIGKIQRLRSPIYGIGSQIVGAPTRRSIAKAQASTIGPLADGNRPFTGSSQTNARISPSQTCEELPRRTAMTLTARRKRLAAAALALALTLTVLASLALARSGGEDGSGSATRFSEQVVANLGRDPALVRSAVDQAKQDLDSGAAGERDLAELLAENLNEDPAVVEAAIAKARQDLLGERLRAGQSPGTG